MSTTEYIKELKDQDIFIHVRDEQLKIKAKKESLTEDILSGIKSRKEELLEFFKMFNAETSDSSTTRITPAPAGNYYPLSSAQRRMYFMYEYDPASVVYNMPQVVKIEGELDRHHLKKSFEGLIARHESLRTSFVLVEGGVVQVVHDQVDFVLEYHQAEESAASAIIGAFVRPFDLRQTSQLRVGLVKLREQTHLLLVDMHHIISDGLSQSQLIQDFRALYQGENLPSLPLQYKDYAVWQQNAKQQSSQAYQQTFWKNEFKEEVSALELPTDFPRPAIRSYRGNSKQFSLSKSESQAIKALADQNGATLFMTLLSCYYLFLGKISGQSDITVGTTTAGRYHLGLENIIGMFVNTIPLRNYPQGNLSFREFLAKVKSKTLECFSYQAYSYEELIGEVHASRQISRNPLFDVMFNLVNYKQEELTLPGLDITAYDSVQPISKFDLTLTASEYEGHLHFSFEYCTDLFTSDTIDRFIVYWRRVVAEVINDPEKELNQIEILSPQERHMLLHTFNNTQVDYPDETLLDLFARQVVDSPTKPAVIYASRKLSYQDLDERSTYLAAHLRSLGVGASERVGILLEPSELVLVSILAVLKVGAAFVPIDQDYPSARKRYMVENSGLKTLLSSTVLIENSQDAITSIAPENLVDVGSPSLWSGNLPVDVWSPAPADVAYVLYTSGSTGHPKGVMITHRALFNYLSWANKTYLRGEDCPMALFSSLSFDLTLTSMFLPLISGNTLHVYSHTAPTSLIEQVLSDGRAKVIKLTPSHLRIVKESGTDISAVRRMIVGGEQLKTDLTAAIQDRGNASLEIYNEYGPTEATIGCMLHKFDRSKAERGSSVSIGKAAPNNEIYLLNDQQQLAPLGTIGEVYIGGVQLMQGYLASEEQTSARLVTNPFRPGQRMYQTGDLARWLPDGTLEFIGRVDDQVKVRGFRIELGEIEQQLNCYEAIRDAVVLVKERAGDQYLVGYYVSETEVPSTKLRDHLSQRLPEYMVPAHFVHRKAFPLTTSGKTDLKKLPDPDNIRYLEEPEEAPRNAIELRLVEIWKQVLNLESLGINNNFFRLGGNSLTAIVLINAINRKLGLTLPTRIVFERQTVKEMCAEIQRMESFKGDFEVGIIKKAMKPKIAHLSHRPDLPYLFFAAPLGGILPPTSMVGIIDMVDELKDTVSFISLQTPPLMPELLDQIERGDEVKLNPNLSVQTIKRLAIEMVEDIFKVQNTSSYCLGGFCTGSALTLEVAKELTKQGKRIEKLILVDPPVWVETMAGRIVDVNYSTDAVAEFVAYDLGWDTPEMDIAYLKEMMAQCPMDKIWKICEDYMKTLNMFDRQFDESEVKKSFERKFYNDLALQFYFVNQPFQYPTLNVEDTLILATKESFTELKQVAQSKFTGRFAVELIEASHHDLFQPEFLKQWNGRIRNHLQKESV